MIRAEGLGYFQGPELWAGAWNTGDFLKNISRLLSPFIYTTVPGQMPLPPFLRKASSSSGKPLAVSLPMLPRAYR